MGARPARPGSAAACAHGAPGTESQAPPATPKMGAEHFECPAPPARRAFRRGAMTLPRASCPRPAASCCPGPAHRDAVDSGLAHTYYGQSQLGRSVSIVPIVLIIVPIVVLSPIPSGPPALPPCSPPSPPSPRSPLQVRSPNSPLRSPNSPPRSPLSPLQA